MASSLYRNKKTGTSVNEKRGRIAFLVNAARLAEDLHLAKQFKCTSLQLLLGQEEPNWNEVSAADLVQFTRVSVVSAARTKDKLAIDTFIKRCANANRMHFDGNGAIFQDISTLPTSVERLTMDVRVLKNSKALSVPEHVKSLKLTGLSNATDVAAFPPRLDFLSISAASLDGFSLSTLPKDLDVLHVYSRQGVLRAAGDVRFDHVRLLRLHVKAFDLAGVFVVPKLTHGYFTNLKSIATIREILSKGTAFVGLNQDAATEADIKAFNLEIADGYATCSGPDSDPFPSRFLNGVPA